MVARVVLDEGQVLAVVSNGRENKVSFHSLGDLIAWMQEPTIAPGDVAYAQIIDNRRPVLARDQWGSMCRELHADVTDWEGQMVVKAYGDRVVNPALAVVLAFCRLYSL